ncbi:MAG: N-6 DNA methylase [Salegentibacter mishustinae]|nr:N-6 DNA methylase [Salegentibacter mishustinae]
MSLILKGLEHGHIKFDEEQKYITYTAPGKRYRFANPEEQVRAESFLSLIFEYGYNPERISLEVTVPRRTPSDLADIVIFEDDGKLTPYIVVECKKQKISEAEFNQAIEQGFGNAVSLKAPYMQVTSGIKTNAYDVKNFPPLERVKNLIADIPRFGQSGITKAKFYKGAKDEDGNPAKDIKVVDQSDLTRVFEQAHQALWAGGKRNPSEAFDELDKLIFCKIWDERKPRKTGQPYAFQEFTGEHPNELLDRIQGIYNEGKEKDPEVFKDPIRLSASELKTIVGYLAELNLHDTDLDSKGRAFETFLGSFFRGDFGQYFTPREVVDFIVKVLPIHNESLVLDTSCGSGGFLLYALDKVRKKADEMAEEGYFKKGSTKHRDHWHDFAEHNLFGIEISEGIARTAKMNMIIHDDGHTNVVAVDGLNPIEEMPEAPGETESQKEYREYLNSISIQKLSNNKGFKSNNFDFIITNPPFGSSIKLTEQAYLKNYALGIKDVNWIDQRLKSNFKLGTRTSQSTEVLFIEQCHRFLKPGGILAVVIPDGILTNSSSQYVRDWIEEHYRIISVVSLPQTAFAANGAGVKSSVLFLMKLDDKQTKKVQANKEKIQDALFFQPQYEQEIKRLDKEKKKIIKEHEGFDYESINWELEENVKVLDGASAPETWDKAARKLAEKTEEFKAWKSDITQLYNEQINEVKENLQDEYLKRIGEELIDYPIMMVIAENIGYDATGRKSGVNELEQIASDLEHFIEDIKTGQDPFFV